MERGRPVPDAALVRLGCWDLRVDAVTGAVTHLVDRVSGRSLADAEHPVGLLAHQSFSEADYARWWDGYVQSPPEEEWWAREDNPKPGIDAAGATSAWWEPERAAVHLGERWSARRGADGPLVRRGRGGRPRRRGAGGSP